MRQRCRRSLNSDAVACNPQRRTRRAARCRRLASCRGPTVTSMGACDPAGAVVPQQRQAWTPACSSGHRRRSPRPSIGKLEIDRVRAVPASTRGWRGSCGSKRDCSILEPAMQNMAQAAWPRPQIVSEARVAPAQSF